MEQVQFSFEVEGLPRLLRVASFEGVESMSQLFHFDITFVSEEKAIPFDRVVGRRARLVLHGRRRIHGIVSRFAQGQAGKQLVAYHATLVPTVWRLLHRHDCRIFQELTIPEIVTRVLEDAGIASESFRFALEQEHLPREYCVQYRESDWAFVSRLLEDEGLMSFFEHDGDREVLVIADSTAVHAAIEGEAEVPFRDASAALHSGECVSTFRYSEEVRPGRTRVRDWNFKQPDLSLDRDVTAPIDDDLEIYDYPTGHTTPDEGATLAQLRLEEWRTFAEVAEGDSSCSRLAPGRWFGLVEHPRDSFNRRYVVTRLEHRGSQATMAEPGEVTMGYSNQFTAIPSTVPFRPTRRTRRPTIKGVQTAIVVGPSGEEIHTDEHGRVKVQFHWDRRGRRDEQSSCWMRVSHGWAGAAFGAMYIPRVGHEVIVDFLEGDPDRPLVVGRVYHGANPPPYVLPAEKTKSTLRSNTTPGGEGSNEILFEDKAGSEEIYLHGQKDWTIVIENDKDQRVGHDERLFVERDRTKTIRRDQSETIEGEKRTQVGRNHEEHIGMSAALIIKNNRTLTVGGGDSQSVGGNATVKIGGNLASSAGGSASLQVGGDRTDGTGGMHKQSVGGNKSIDVTGSYTLEVAEDVTLSAGGDHQQLVKGSQKVIVGEYIMIECGKALVMIEKSGHITVQGRNIDVNALGTVKIEADKPIDLTSSADVTVKAAKVVKVKGAKVEVN
jgi:type VI secretion system secreted protein VgrG